MCNAVSCDPLLTVHWLQGLPMNGHPETVAIYAVLLTTMGSLISWAVSLPAACDVVLHATVLLPLHCTARTAADAGP
jgi:hypothetical protein